MKLTIGKPISENALSVHSGEPNTPTHLLVTPFQMPVLIRAASGTHWKSAKQLREWATIIIAICR